MDYAKQFPVLENDRVCGCATVNYNGLHCRFDCICSPSNHNILRVYAEDTGKNIICVGPIVNNGTCFRAYRTFTRTELAAHNFDPYQILNCHLSAEKPSAAVAIPEMKQEPEIVNTSKNPQEWKLCASPSDICHDTVILSSLSEAEEIWMLRNGDDTWIGVPLDKTKPFTLNPAFMVVRPVDVNNRLFGAILVDKQGKIINSNEYVQ
jgi:hypothetical protein